MLSYAAWNQHGLALSSFDQCFLSAEITSAIVILRAMARVFYIITKRFKDSTVLKDNDFTLHMMAYVSDF